MQLVVRDMNDDTDNNNNNGDDDEPFPEVQVLLYNIAIENKNKN